MDFGVHGSQWSHLFAHCPSGRPQWGMTKGWGGDLIKKHVWGGGGGGSVRKTERWRDIGSRQPSPKHLPRWPDEHHKAQADDTPSQNNCSSRRMPEICSTSVLRSSSFVCSSMGSEPLACDVADG